MTKSKPIQAVFFDLDGTLLDTAPDLAFAMNQLLQQRGLALVNFPAFRRLVSKGTTAMLKFALGIDNTDANFEKLRAEFLALYLEHLATHTQFFPGMAEVLNYLCRQDIYWGIVTSKPQALTKPLLKNFSRLKDCTNVVCGDTLTVKKPHPDTLLHACRAFNIDPSHAIYIGDAFVDIQTAKAAGMQSIAVTYGYYDEGDDPNTWQADYVMHSPQEILTWLQQNIRNENYAQ